MPRVRASAITSTSSCVSVGIARPCRACYDPDEHVIDLNDPGQFRPPRQDQRTSVPVQHGPRGLVGTQSEHALDTARGHAVGPRRQFPANPEPTPSTECGCDGRSSPPSRWSASHCPHAQLTPSPRNQPPDRATQMTAEPASPQRNQAR
jgi:hypothetical protein